MAKKAAKRKVAAKPAAKWRLAKSLDVLRSQINELAPERKKGNDGTIGDAAHASRTSDHNPWVRDGSMGVVTALDITHDPASGVDTHMLADFLRQQRDSRIKYVISAGRIFSSTQQPWTWRKYTGTNGHYSHMHVSVKADKLAYDDPRSWNMPVGLLKKPPVPPPAPPPVQPGMPQQAHAWQTEIIATVFGGKKDPNKSAYDDTPITDTELGVALPYRFPTNDRPNVFVRNEANGKTVLCEIRDVGPWNTNDPYWLTGERPQAATGVDTRGRKTNLAGIDVTPAVDRALELKGKGLVSWAFEPDEVPTG
jgi:hypothetical protein